jgi:hypothetical protein
VTKAEATPIGVSQPERAKGRNNNSDLGYFLPGSIGNGRSEWSKWLK